MDLITFILIAWLVGGFFGYLLGVQTERNSKD